MEKVIIILKQNINILENFLRINEMELVYTSVMTGFRISDNANAIMQKELDNK